MGADGEADKSRGRLLVVEDEALIADYLIEILEELGFEVCGPAAIKAEAVALAEAHRPDLALVDVQLRGREDGVETARELKNRFGINSLLLSGAVDSQLVARASDIPPAGFLPKPYTVPQLQATIERLLARLSSG
jgi:DNA-binding NarL/FixJ family response regulator